MSCGHPECTEAVRRQAKIDAAKTEARAAAIKNRWDRVIVTHRTVNDSYGYRDPNKPKLSDKVVDVEILVV